MGGEPVTRPEARSDRVREILVEALEAVYAASASSEFDSDDIGDLCALAAQITARDYLLKTGF